jgi:hypothetical protein
LKAFKSFICRREQEKLHERPTEMVLLVGEFRVPSMLLWFYEQAADAISRRRIGMLAV